MTRMRFQWSLAFWAILLAVSVSFAICQDSESVKEETGVVAKLPWYKLHSLFSFEDFKHFFGKKYPNMQEEMARAKIFLAREFKRLISVVKYKFKRSASYLGLYKFSDMTRQELSRRVMKKPELWNKRVDTSDSSDHIEEAVDLEELKEAFEEIDQQQDKPGYAELKIVLSKSSRRKRATNEREESVEELLAPVKPAPRVPDSLPPSNNPKYVPVELDSMGTERPNSILSLGIEIISNIQVQSGVNFIWSSLESLTNMFALPIVNRDDSSENEVSDVDAMKEGDKSETVKAYLPDEVFVDYRNCFVEPKQQGDCGSCYVFAVNALYEWFYCKITGKRVSFSEQYPLDCSPEGPKKIGCDGGYTHEASRWMNSYGFHLRKLYPYEEKVNQCPFSKGIEPEEMAYLKVDSEMSRRLPFNMYDYFLLRKGPIMITVLTGPGLYFHKGGVTDIPECDQEEWHAVVAVGAGRENGIEYWLVRNSWGSDWGEGGYFKLDKNSNCIVKDRGEVIRKAGFGMNRSSKKRKEREEGEEEASTLLDSSKMLKLV